MKSGGEMQQLAAGRSRGSTLAASAAMTAGAASVRAAAVCGMAQQDVAGWAGAA